MRCGPWASAVRVGPHGPAWGARAGTERTELLRAVASYFVQYVEGKVQGNGTMDSNGVSLEQLKLNYASLGKKTRIGQEMLMNAY